MALILGLSLDIGVYMFRGIERELNYLGVEGLICAFMILACLGVMKMVGEHSFFLLVFLATIMLFGDLKHQSYPAMTRK